MTQRSAGAHERLDAQVRSWLAFLATYDAHDPADRQLVYRVRERVYGELYRREREWYPEWIDLGGQG